MIMDPAGPVGCDAALRGREDEADHGENAMRAGVARKDTNTELFEDVDASRNAGTTPASDTTFGSSKVGRIRVRRFHDVPPS